MSLSRIHIGKGLAWEKKGDLKVLVLLEKLKNTRTVLGSGLRLVSLELFLQDVRLSLGSSEKLLGILETFGRPRVKMHE